MRAGIPKMSRANDGQKWVMFNPEQHDAVVLKNFRRSWYISTEDLRPTNSSKPSAESVRKPCLSLFPSQQN
jgi:hypothetical protein